MSTTMPDVMPYEYSDRMDWSSMYTEGTPLGGLGRSVSRNSSSPPPLFFSASAQTNVLNHDFGHACALAAGQALGLGKDGLVLPNFDTKMVKHLLPQKLQLLNVKSRLIILSRSVWRAERV